MIYIGMDVHQKSTTFCLFDPSSPEDGQYRTVTQPTTEERIRQTLVPLGGQCQVAFEVGTQAQWIAAIIRPLAADVQVANPSRIPWLFRDGRKNDRLDARKLATLLYLKQLPTVHLPQAEVSAWRALINHRRKLVTQRTQIKNQIRAILRASLSVQKPVDLSRAGLAGVAGVRRSAYADDHHAAGRADLLRPEDRRH